MVDAFAENDWSPVNMFGCVKSRPTVTPAVSPPEPETVNPPFAAFARVAT